MMVFLAFRGCVLLSRSLLQTSCRCLVEIKAEAVLLFDGGSHGTNNLQPTCCFHSLSTGELPGLPGRSAGWETTWPLKAGGRAGRGADIGNFIFVCV